MRKDKKSILFICLLVVCLGVFLQGVQQVTAAENKPTVYICGDSTVQTYRASCAPQAAWGQFISQYFTTDVLFANKAISGRSSKSFIKDGHLDEIMNLIKPNDYLFVQFGHNDATKSKPERYIDPNTTYKEYLRQYIDQARLKGAIPVLITPVTRLHYVNGIFKNDFPAYCKAMKEVAVEKGVACIDSMNKSLIYYTSIGYDQVFPFYMVSVNNTDYTHFTETGATQIARIVAESVKELNLSISKYVINSTTTTADYKFDFGGGDVQSGFIGVSAFTAYNVTQGYGFNTPQYMKNVTASGNGAASDAVHFLTYGTKSSNTFNLDLPNGLYEVKVTLGDIKRASVAAEGVFQIMNMTGNCAKDKFQIPITDGQLNLLITEGKVGTVFTLSSLEIKKLSDDPTTNRTIYIGGDSTVCNYYPLDSSVQAGWGQMFPNFVDTSVFQIRNMATGGQYARGFRDDGQFEAIMKYLKPGDYFILQFGINDTNPKNNETEAQFKEIMRDMVKQAKVTGATVVLSTPQGRATDFNSENVHSAVNRWYRPSTVALASEEDVRLVDLNVLSSAYFTSIGKEATLALYMTGDTLHPNRVGATQLARIVAEDLDLPDDGSKSYKFSDGFSSIQGQNNWYYMQLNGSTYSYMTWNSSLSYWKGAGIYNLIWAPSQIHPDTNDSVAVFKAPWSGKVRITGNPRKANVTRGDGVLVKIMKNTTQVWPASGWQTITNTSGVRHDETIRVKTNDMIYFIVNKNSNAGHDETTWDPTITYQSKTSSDYSVSYEVQNSWGTGASVNVTIENNSQSLIDGWTLEWTFPGDQKISNVWNGSYHQNGASVSVKDTGYNANISANGTVSFGFNVSYTDSNEKPANFILNGITCIIQK